MLLSSTPDQIWSKFWRPQKTLRNKKLENSADLPCLWHEKAHFHSENGKNGNNGDNGKKEQPSIIIVRRCAYC